MVSGFNKKSIFYHDIFNYPLTKEDLRKWHINPKLNFKSKPLSIESKNDFYFLKGRGSIVNERVQNEESSKRKLVIARKASALISKVPTVLFIGITGSLAMMNAKKEGDIDLLIITKQGRLWITRFLVYLLLKFSNLKLRKPRDNNEKDKLCLNMWMDESDLVWEKKDRNIYTSHEIAQILPLHNKNKTYEKFLYLNNWLLRFWPNSARVSKVKVRSSQTTSSFFEKIAFYLQYKYMEKKISREVVTPTRAIFHPNNWGGVVIRKLNSVK